MADLEAPLRYYCEACRTRGRGPADGGLGDPWRSADERRIDYLPCPHCRQAMLDLASEQTWAYLEELDRRNSDRYYRRYVRLAIVGYISAFGCLIFAWTVPILGLLCGDPSRMILRG